jgi:hypothetical protein
MPILEKKNLRWMTFKSMKIEKHIVSRRRL